MVINVSIGTVVGREIIENRDSENESRMLSVELSEANDVQSVEHINQNGEQTNPLDDTTVLVLELNPSWKLAIAINDLVDIDENLDPGEKKIYAVDSSNNIVSSIYLRNTGIVEVGGGDQFVALANKVDSFISDVVDLLTGWTVLAQDGGAALQTEAKALWDVGMGGTPPSTVASSNLKADE